MKCENEQPKQIDKIHACLLVIVREIKRVCDKNKIPYFMLAGTLLGAVRHKGFIPWDDDMDFGMMRSDYNEFIEACERDLDKEHFFIQRTETDPMFGKFYIRVLLKDTFLDYDLIKETKQMKALFVDVFPYDNIPSSKIKQKIQSFKINFALRLLKKKLGYRFDRMGVFTKIELLFEKFYSKERLIKMYNREMQKYNDGSESEYVNSANAGYGYYREILKRKWVTNLTEMEFEGIMLPGSAEYDEYLTHLYGDYMQIPSEEEIETHHFEDIDFGPYDNILDK